MSKDHAENLATALTECLAELWNYHKSDNTREQFDLFWQSEIKALSDYKASKQMPDTAAFAKGNTASKQAAGRIRSNLTGMRATVYGFIVMQGEYGATGSEVAEALDMLLYTAKPRCTELAQAGFIVDSGKLRQNSNKRNETVWILNTGRKPV